MIATPTVAACHAPLLFSQMKAATGGTAWNQTGETLATGSVSMSGLTGSAVLASDLSGGRYAQRFNVTAMGISGTGFDGDGVWSQDISGGVHPVDAPFSRQSAVTDAYLTRHGYFTASGATFVCLGDAIQDGRRVVRIRVTPTGGIPAVLSIDASSHLLASISERLPTTTDVTRYADYRAVGDLALPFTVMDGTLAEPADGYTVHVTHYIVKQRPQTSDFSSPHMQHPAHMRDGAASTTVPLALEGRQLIVWASIDGHRAMPFILDTGGHAILTTGAARALGLHAQGAGVSGGSGAGTVALQYASVNSLRIGGAELRHQKFLVIDYPFSFYERGPRQPLAGILGLEVFERFATRIDYGRLRLTLTPFDRYESPSDARAVPIVFQEDLPLADAAADGHRGLFGIDTGNAGTVILFGTFLNSTGLEHRYTGGVKGVGQGTGGSDAGRLEQLQHFSFAERTFAKVPTFLTHMKSGSFSSWTEAGNFGYEILSRFVPTFDYARKTLYLETRPWAHGPASNHAGFIAGKVDPSVFVVYRVSPNSAAAAAGIHSGDRIVQIDGKPATQFSYADLYTLVTSAPGTRLRLVIEQKSNRRDVTLVLR